MYLFQIWAERNLVIFERGETEYKVQCLNPKHEDVHPSAYFNIEKGIYHCFSCGYSGTVGNNQISDLDMKIQAAKERLRGISEDKEEQTFVSDDVLNRYKISTDYWTKDRHLNQETINLFQLGYDPIADAVTIPVRNIQGYLYGVTRRFLSDEYKGARYKYPKRFSASQNLFASWLSDDYDMSTISVHEGAIDAMRMWQLGIPATALYRIIHI